MIDSWNRKMLVSLVTATVSIMLYGCGGGGGTPGNGGSAQRAVDSPTIQRSVRLDSYQAWHLVPHGSHQNPAKLEEGLRNLAKRDNVCYTEITELVNSTPGWSKLTPSSIKAINPTAKVYRIWASLKPVFDTDWGKTGTNIQNQAVVVPIAWEEIEKNNWWLRDSNGEIIRWPTDSNEYFIDLGKPGVKEAYLSNALAKMQGKGFDGVVLDASLQDIDWYTPEHAIPKGYKDSNEWFEKAWKPFFSYVTQGFRKAGYKVIQNCGGEYLDSNPRKIWNRSQIDGVIYEQWAVDWTNNGSGWLPQDKIARRIESLNTDPLEVWTADFGLVSTDKEYRRKATVGLAMYYIAIPQVQDRRSYNHYHDGTAFWDSLWDLYIGVPSELGQKMTGKFFWSRKFTQGLVLLNYEEDETIDYTLTQTYHDASGKTFNGKIDVPPHTGVILAIGQ